jgi:diguanylate cyclase (GGDEF)-like protein/PAS domain S-box-containing protein
MRTSRILIVDGVPSTLGDAATSLEELGYAVVAVLDGAAAVLAAKSFHPDLVVLDLHEDGAHGVETAQRLHEELHLPVVFLSALADDALAERVRVSDSFGYLEKPFSRRELGTVVELALHRQRMERVLALGETRFRLLFDHNPAGVVVESVDGRILECNHALAHMLGYASPDPLRDQPAAELFHDPLEDLEHRHRLASGGTISNEETRLRHRDGKAVWAVDNAVLVPDPGTGRGQILRTLMDITERKQVEQGLERLAYRDALTGLPNRRLLEVRAEQTLAEAKRRGESAALLFIDLVGFKQVNDQIGHLGGDELLVQVARRISDCLRRTDAAARFGGDEFMVLLSGVDDRVAAQRAARRMLSTLSTPFQLQAGEVRIQARAGVATYPDQADTFDGLVEIADRVLMKAKAFGVPGVFLQEDSPSDDRQPGRPRSSPASRR